MLDHALLVAPDFALILLGLLLARRFGFARGFWEGTERLVYYVLFPVLLFTSIAGSRFSLVDDARMLGAAIGAFVVATALGHLAAPILKPAAQVFAPCVQTAFRFNSYIALAVAQSLAGAHGVAKMAVIMALAIPLANLFAVHVLARHGNTGVLRELARNPLIIGTIAGLAANALGLHLPAFAANAATRLGAASLALGLLCVGAALSLAGAAGNRVLLGWFAAVKLLAFPATALLLIAWLQPPPASAQIALVFAAAPTATSAYVLATRMGFDGAPVSFAITMQTLAAMLTLPLWLAVS